MPVASRAARRSGMASYLPPDRVLPAIKWLARWAARRMLSRQPSTIQLAPGRSGGKDSAQPANREQLQEELLAALDDMVRLNDRVQAELVQRRKAEEALGHERDLLAALMDNVPDAIYFKDLESRFTRVNRSVAERSGLNDPSEVVGKTDADFFQTGSASNPLRDEQEVIRTGRPIVGLEEKEVWRDGRVTWSSTTKMPLRDRGGNIIGTFGISRDITDHKLAEEELRQAKESAEAANRVLDSILKNLADGVVVADESADSFTSILLPKKIIGVVRPNVASINGPSITVCFSDGVTPHPPL